MGAEISLMSIEIISPCGERNRSHARNRSREPTSCRTSDLDDRQLPSREASRQHLLDHLPMHVGQTALDSVVIEADSFVLESQEVQDRGVKVVRCDGVLLGAKSECVGRP